MSLPCLFTLWLEGEGLGRELIVEGEGKEFVYFFLLFCFPTENRGYFSLVLFSFFFLEISEHEH